MTNKTAKIKQTHVYLTKAQHTAVKERAAQESRSVTGQIEHYISRGLAEDAEK